MRENWRKYQISNAPRYTSYPSALHFDETIGNTDYRNALEHLDAYDAISIYIHIPFCRKLCWYCGCNMSVENKYERTRPYLVALLKEIQNVASILHGRGVTTQIHFGGGTPNYLHTEDIKTILEAIEIGFGITDRTPVVMELDPRLCSTEKIQELAGISVTRMSLGVQDFSLDVQKAINRVQSFERIEECVSAMRQADIHDISFDLLYGLPKQTICNFAETINKTLSLAPDRISLFGYAHLPLQIQHQQLIHKENLPSSALRAELAEFASKNFQDAGYQRIGFDHFAKPENAIAQANFKGRLNRNFQGFTEDPALHVIGFGVSAISHIHNLYAQNNKSLSAYNLNISENGLAVARGISVSLLSQKIGQWIKQLLCHGIASLKDYQNITNLGEEEMQTLSAKMAPFIADGLVEVRGSDIVIAKEARIFARLIAAQFDPLVAQEPYKLSQAV